MSPIVVVDYDPSWPRLFESLKSVVWPAVADIAISIRHAGSTSVPGLAAKPVIDIDVVVPEAQVTAGIARLGSLGYEHQGDLGVSQREAFRSRPGSRVTICTLALRRVQRSQIISRSGTIFARILPMFARTVT